MKIIEVAATGGRIKINDDRTYQEVTIYPEDKDQLNELVLKLTIELLKGAE